MTRPPQKPRSAAAPSTAPTWIDAVLFGTLLAMVTVRAMISETFVPVELALLDAMQFESGTTPATTAILDALLFVVTAIVLIRYPRRSGGGAEPIALGLLAVAIVTSAIAAGNVFVALLAGSNLLILLLAGAALLRIRRTRAMQQLLVAALLATAATTALKCVSQEVYEFPETERYWEQEKKPELLEKGFDSDDPLFVNYERRLMAREPHGFLTHPNLTASVLMMAALVLLGIGLSSVVVHAAAIGTQPPTARLAGIAILGSLVGLLWWGMSLTGSLGALAAALAGAVVLLVAGALAKWIARRSTLCAALFVIAYVIGIVVIVVMGVRGMLPHPSLEFRWYYWTAAVDVWQDAPLTGVGRENFAASYMLHKSAASTEEVRNPHNVWLSLLVELGPLGLLAGAILAWAWLRRALRRLVPSPEDPASSEDRTAAGLPTIVNTALGVLLLHLIFSGTPITAEGMAIVWLYDIGVKWGAAYALTLWLLRSAPGVIESTWVRAALVGVLAGALLHGVLSFAMLTPGGLAILILCVAATAGVVSRPPERLSGAPSRSQSVVALVMLALIGAHAAVVAIPSLRGEAAVERVSKFLRSTPIEQAPRRADRLFDAALAANQLDPSVPRRIARRLLSFGSVTEFSTTDRLRYLRRGERIAAEAIRRNPRNTNHYGLQARIYALQADVLVAEGRVAEAIDAWRQSTDYWEQAVARYPTDPRLRISAGRAWFALWQLTNETVAGQRARTHLDQALVIDAQRAEGDVVRLRAAELDEIAACRAALAASTQPAPSTP